MMHSMESVQKAMEALRNAMNEYSALPYTELRLHISQGNMKIGKVHNFSMAPGHTCANCAGCLPYCYDIKAVLQYPNVVKARAENTVMMQKNREATFIAIAEYLEKHNMHKAFRWHVSGDILDIDYFDRMCALATAHPDWTFWTYTKNYKSVNDWIDANSGPDSYWRDSVPSNLVPMFSIWNGMPCPNPHRLPTFTCIQEGMTPAPGDWYCPGNCQVCLESGHGCPHGESSYVREH